MDYDRITDLLRKQSPAFSEQNLARSFSISPEMTQSYTQQYNQLQQQPVQQALDIVKVFEAKKASGDAKAKALDDKINMFTGGDPEGHVLFLQALHDDPEEIDPTNSYQVMTKLASIAKRTGYKSPELDLDRRKKEAEIKKLENIGTKAPSGYRFDESGGLEPIPGGPADQKFLAKKATDQSLVESNLSAIDKQLSLVNEIGGVKDNKGNYTISPMEGLSHNFGTFAGVSERDLPTVRQSTADAQTKLKQLEANTFLAALQDLKSKSATGASGLGQLSNIEGEKLQNAIAALGKEQSTESFLKNLEIYKDELEATKKKILTGYQTVYGENKSSPGGVAPDGTIITNAQGQKMQKVNGKWEPM